MSDRVFERQESLGTSFVIGDFTVGHRAGIGSGHVVFAIFGRLGSGCGRGRRSRRVCFSSSIGCLGNRDGAWASVLDISPLDKSSIETSQIVTRSWLVTYLSAETCEGTGRNLPAFWAGVKEEQDSPCVSLVSPGGGAELAPSAGQAQVLAGVGADDAPEGATSGEDGG